MPVLVTTNDIIEENDIAINNKLKIIITFNNGKIIIDNKSKNRRKIFITKEYPITFIEIKDNDKLDINSFLIMEEQMVKDTFQANTLLKQLIYLIYEAGKISEFSTGIIKQIYENQKKFKFLSKNQVFSSGFPY